MQTLGLYFIARFWTIHGPGSVWNPSCSRVAGNSAAVLILRNKKKTHICMSQQEGADYWQEQVFDEGEGLPPQ